MIATLGWLAGCFSFVAVFAWALCRAAADGDILATRCEEHDRDQLADVAHFDCERRRRRSDIRNGISGGAA